MRNLFDYINDYKDHTMATDPFNNIDALILARLSYIPFEDILDEGGLTIAQAAHKFFRIPGSFDRLAMPKDATLLAELGRSRRFRNMELLFYINKRDADTQEQFAAMTVITAANSCFISYRGTDNTLIGWKEDFNMGFMDVVPAQLDAVFYMQSVADAVPGSIMAGGHSKGGNLAVYASIFSGLDARLAAVYNFDGPGFGPGVLQQPGYSAMQDRIHTFVPQSSVVGMLLEHEEHYHVISSTRVGLWQHDLYSWEVDDNDFVYLSATTSESKYIDATLKSWLSKMQPAQREQFVNIIYDILKSTRATTLRELADNWHINALLALKSFDGLDEPVKHAVLRALALLVESALITRQP